MTTRHPGLGHHDTDFIVVNHGSICILQAHTDAGSEWIAENIDPDAQAWYGGIVVEPRYIADIVAGIEADGLTVA